MGDSDRLGLVEAVSIALGGMIGGGIYAVLGVVAQVTMAAVWAAFLLAGVVALCAGYSYDRLNALSEGTGGSVSFVQSFLGNSTLAGMIGWTLLLGYVGSMAMYGFAFAEFAIALGLPEGVAGLPTRPVVSVLTIAAFVGLNLLGARTTGSVENVLVATKVLVLGSFGVFGLVYAFRFGGGSLDFGVDRLTGSSPVVAAAISFVAFQGWQLLFYDQESIEDSGDTIRKAVSISIPVAVVIYVLVGIVTVNLAPEALRSHPHVALKDAARTMASPYGLGALGAVLISVSALFSTGSAINATLFSAAHLAKGMLTDDLLPDDVGDAGADGAPERTLLLLGGVTALFSAVGSLGAITSFASLSFIVVFGAMSYLAFRQRGHDDVRALPPAVGVVGTAAFFPLMLYDLYTREPGTFYTVLVVAAVVVAVELLYFERARLEREVEEFEEAVGIASSSEE